MTASFPLQQATQFLTDSEESATPKRDADPFEDSILADAEAEQMAELWEGDTGNQGA